MRAFFLVPAFALPFLIMLLYYTLNFLKSYRRVKKRIAAENGQPAE